MTIFILFLFSLGPMLFLCLLVYAWKRKHDQVLKSANYNALAWAESEARKHETEIENARLRGIVETGDKAFATMSRIASEAIRCGEDRTSLPSHLRMPIDDSILSADNLE